MQTMNLRVWDKPRPKNVYAIGGDPAEGLAHGDDSVIQVIDCENGWQVAELQGKIEPFAFAEHAFMLGTWYNNALVGIESNKDGGANRVLQELKYPNIYKDVKDVGETYDKYTEKLGININLHNRHKLVAQSRHMMEEDLAKPHSKELVSQFEIFVLRNLKYEAIPGGHDDLVMAWVIACEMMRIACERKASYESDLEPLWEGRSLDEEFEDSDVGLIDRHVAQAKSKQIDQHSYSSTTESLV